MNPPRQRIVDAGKARREGQRYRAFYQGYHARRANRPGNPFTRGSADYYSWEAGWKYAESESQDRIEAVPPLCRFGPGGDFVRDWPEEQYRGQEG